ncbi:MAG: fibronectin type III domain-containing protein [bacterium]|nr:fibronectin type III domain-containing protein [bacterium]
MMIRFAKFGKTLNALLLIIIFFLAIFSITGCGGNADIPEASVLSSGRLTLSWMDVLGAASYDLYISTSPGVTTLNSYKLSHVATPMTITDLEPGTTYYFIITVYNDSGESRNSKEVSYTVAKTEGAIDFGDLLVESEPLDKSPPAAIAPAAPAPREQTAMPKASGPAGTTIPTVSKESAPAAIPKSAPVESKKSSQAVPSSVADTRDVTLAWDNVPGATSYNIYWSDKPGVTRRNGTKSGNVKNPHKLKGLIKGKKYYFVVTAVNQSGESSESAEFSFTVGE